MRKHRTELPGPDYERLDPQPLLTTLDTSAYP
jgi:hypothetical protein